MMLLLCHLLIFLHLFSEETMGSYDLVCAMQLSLKTDLLFQHFIASVQILGH
jgi:hypothetical protein